jgi:hypothetical protein
MGPEVYVGYDSGRLRSIYLTREPRDRGRSHFVGRRLYDAIRGESSTALPAFAVLDLPEDIALPRFLSPDDLIRVQTLRDFNPDVIMLEGGLFGGLAEPRLPLELAGELVRAGTILVIADIGFNEATESKSGYAAASRLLGAHIDYGPDDERWPTYGSLPSGSGKVWCPAERMLLSEWLRPTYAGIDGLLVGRPLHLRPFQLELLATCDPTTTMTLRQDLPVDVGGSCVFGTVNSLGDGYVVSIAADFSDDHFTTECPDNIAWLLNVVRHLRGEAANERGRRQPLRELQRAVREARDAAAGLEGDEAGEAYARVLSQALEANLSGALARPRAKAVRADLEQSMGANWTALGVRTRDLLVQAEILRLDTENYATEDPSADFASAVHGFSRAIESATFETLFAPFMDRDIQLPPDVDNKDIKRSLGVLRRLQVDGAKAPELGTMAYCLRYVGCRGAGLPENGFAALLDELLAERDSFCKEFPGQLIRYSETYRNGAAHLERMTLEQCMAARTVLLDEPPRLLKLLVSSLRN